jgi:hypothetical protein
VQITCTLATGNAINEDIQVPFHNIFLNVKTPTQIQDLLIKYYTVNHTHTVSLFLRHCSSTILSLTNVSSVNMTSESHSSGEVILLILLCECVCACVCMYLYRFYCITFIARGCMQLTRNSENIVLQFQSMNPSI